MINEIFRCTLHVISNGLRVSSYEKLLLLHPFIKFYDTSIFVLYSIHN